jgi:glutathione S-transferase
MYTLYYSPSACSLATQVVLHELGQAVEIKNVQQLENFKSINPVGAVPVLLDVDKGYTDKALTEGAAIILYLLNKHENTLLPATGHARQQGIENMMFANATMHPSYGRLFFIAQHISDESLHDKKIRQAAFDTAAKSINYLWQVVEQKLALQPNNEIFLGGAKPSAADILLAVYSRWGASFPVEITLGPKVQKMLAAVLALPSFKKALAAEQG